MDPITMKTFVESLIKKEKEDTFSHNRDLLTAFLGTTPVGNRAQRIPILVTLRSKRELNDVKALIGNVYEGGPLWPVGTLGTWRDLPDGPATVRVRIDAKKSEVLVRAFVRKNPSVLSFVYLNDDPTALDYVAKSAQHCQDLKEKHAVLK